MNALLTLEDVDVFYGPVQALRGVSLQIDAGDLTSFRSLSRVKENVRSIRTP